MSFLTTKKTPAPTREEDGWMMSAALDLRMYFSMVSSWTVTGCRVCYSAGKEVNSAVIGPVRWKRQCLVLTQNLMQIMVFCGNWREIWWWRDGGL